MPGPSSLKAALALRSPQGFSVLFEPEDIYQATDPDEGRQSTWADFMTRFGQVWVTPATDPTDREADPGHGPPPDDVW